jgi:DNA-binding MarR family transcriptional regulator
LTHEVRDRCLCLAAQRAARALARRFDLALRPVGLTNGQFSLLNALNQAKPPALGRIAEFLAMDRTTLTAALKVLERQGLVTTVPDATDRRSRRLMLTDAGHERLAAAIPLWRAAHDRLDSNLSDFDPERLRAALWPLGSPKLRQSDAQ